MGQMHAFRFVFMTQAAVALTLPALAFSHAQSIPSAATPTPFAAGGLAQLQSQSRR